MRMRISDGGIIGILILVILNRRSTTRVSDGSELIGRCVTCDPLLHCEELLTARHVRTRGGDLDVVAVPSMVRTGPVRGQVHGADGSTQARSTAAENVEIASLEVVVAGAHEASPCFQIRDLDRPSSGVVECEADDGVCPTFEDGPSSYVHHVHAAVIIVNHLTEKIDNTRSRSRKSERR